MSCIKNLLFPVQDFDLFSVEDFDRTWDLLADMGNVDCRPGNEYRVTKAMWIAAGMDNPPHFIMIEMQE